MKQLKGVISLYDYDVLYHPMGKKSLLAGRPLKGSSLKSIFSFVAGMEDFVTYSFKGLVPKNIIKYNTESGKIIFYTSECFRTMIFNQKEIETTTYSIPKLLWVYNRMELKIYALKDEPTDENQILYQAPFLNVSSNGSVCMGSVDFKNKSGNFDGLSEIITDLFFNSIFTHTNCDKLSTENILEVYKKAKSKDFLWNEYLVPTKLKLIDVL